MVWLNDFVAQNFSSCQDYFDEMAKIPSKTKARIEVEISTGEREEAMKALHKHLERIQPKIKEKFELKSWYNEFLQIMDEIEDSAKVIETKRSNSVSSADSARNSSSARKNSITELTKLQSNV